MKNARLKVYTEKFGLIKSRIVKHGNEIQDLLEELCIYTPIKAVYLTDGKQSREIKFILKSKVNHPIYYTRHDGTTAHTLSINPLSYPMTAHYENGRTEIINL